MPYVIDPLRRRGTILQSIAKRDYKYNYPIRRNLKPGSKLHEKLVDLVMDKVQASHSAMSTKYDTWNELDNTLTAYIRADDDEQALIETDERKPISMVVPTSYAMLETLLAYLVAAYLNDPIFRYDPFDTEDTLGVGLLEAVIAQQCRWFRNALSLHTTFRDSFVYGLGAVTPVWSKHTGFRRVAEQGGFWSDMFGRFVQGETKRVRKEVTLFEGNRLYNIDPYRYFPDVSVPVQNVQDGNYCGWLQRTSKNALLTLESQSEWIFNARYVNDSDARSVYNLDNSERDKAATMQLSEASDEQAVDVIYMGINIIPKDVGVGNSEDPEKWLFGVAGDSILIQATPQELDHNMFPVAVCAPSYDGYTATPVSVMEQISGMQTLANYLLNSHVQNIRKGLNDMWIADPSMVNMNDVYNPDPAKVIRLRRRAWGRGVDSVIKQFPVVDVTQQNVGEIGFVMEMMKVTTGATDPIMGLFTRTGDRKSATEWRGTRDSALYKIERGARIAGDMLLYSLGYMIASQTQQFMSDDVYVRLVGEKAAELSALYGKSAGKVSPLDVLVEYDVIVGDGSLPTSGDPNAWLAAMQLVASNPALMQTFDIVRIFKQWARFAGAKNIGDFVAKKMPGEMQVQPDEEVARQAEAGNIIPANQLGLA